MACPEGLRNITESAHTKALPVSVLLVALLWKPIEIPFLLEPIYMYMGYKYVHIHIIM